MLALRSLLLSLSASLVLAACAVGASSADLSTETAPADPAGDPDASSETLKAPAPGAPDADGGAKDASAKDGGAKADAGSASAACAGYATPTESASCNACGSKPCQPNGCYGGYYCTLSTSKCTPKPSSCP